MSLSITHLPTHWEAGEAYTVIAFLDLLRDQLWETNGEEVTAMLRAAETRAGYPQQDALDFDDQLDF